MSDSTPMRQIRAVFDEQNVRVYQAYGDAIADSALEAGTFVEPAFSMTRMTWIKPSFLWMMYRSGWGRKDLGQSRVLAVDISRDGFEWALANSSLSHVPGLSVGEARAIHDRCPVRVQWDPERDLRLDRLVHRSIQIGLRGEAVRRYVDEWVVSIEDITESAQEIESLVRAGRVDEARAALPNERAYPLPGDLAQAIGAG